MLPPSNLAFNVTTRAPTQTITKTSANSGPPSFSSSESLEPWSILEKKIIARRKCKQSTYTAMNVQRSKGPQRSHSLSSILLSVRRGCRTYRNLTQTALTSLRIVSITGSSKVLYSPWTGVFELRIGKAMSPSTSSRPPSETCRNQFLVPKSSSNLNTHIVYSRV